MAKQLIDDMTEVWKPDAHSDKFTKSIHALVAKKVKDGATFEVESMEAAATTSNVVDLTALLRQRLGKPKGAGAQEARPTAKKTVRRKRA